VLVVGVAVVGAVAMVDVLLVVVGCSNVALVRSRTADVIGTVGTFLAVSVTVCTGRRRVSDLI
jgi:hypothetical protein